ncbi:TonB-dependent receptor [Sphingopyxis macrogoltabida]|uniref:TonB-dependent receptor n=1 Tax=Sphingopyxis macrogoltabida TaxID=33050 RepID=A0AAC9AZR2_SPHMC|nr:TonB-dependent receptor [Sphingopyxis macrogoltabida]ALJ16530.1 TonB-dependent receptor [Sphingopyxis macrogoltabida]AMU92762.1 TonB-dependent receptor [Sphingopyxis macrogoltabida]
MKTATFRILVSGAAILSPLHAAMAQEAAAPEAPAAQEETYPGEILVTAQRREERVQDIPVAITAFGGQQVEKLGILSLENIAPRVPSFYFGSFGAARPQLYIRGIGTRSFDPGSESSVGVFVDDVYAGRASGSFGSLRDVERIEVLRGPQGTLYGRNTIAGAINVITKGPTDYFTGEAEAGISNYDGYSLFGAVGGPIAGDKLMFRVAGWKAERDGYQTNLQTGTKFQGIDNWGGRARLRFAPSEQLTIDLTAELSRDGDKAAFSGFSRGSGPAESLAGVITPANPLATFLGRPGRTPIPYFGGNAGNLSFDPYLDRKTETYIGRVEYDAGFATITSISALKKLRISDGRDLEGTSLDIANQLSNERSKQFSQEIRITSDPSGPASFDGNLDWIIGAFYYRDRSARSDEFRLGVDSVVALLSGGPQVSTAISDYEIDSYAIFGQATIHLGEKFEVTLGGRYTRDEKRAVQQGLNTRPGVPLIAVPFLVDNSATYESFDPRIVATYKFSPDASIYASYSTGFKSGGFQYVPFSAAQANVLFQPEDIKTYEVGFKSEWLDRRLRFNVAAFHYDYKDLQVSRIVDLGGGSAASLISNAAASKIYGADVELLLRPSDNIDFSVTYGYLDAKYDAYFTNADGVPPTAATDFSDRRLVRAPKHSINVGAEWRIPTGDNSGLTLRADYALLDEFYHEPGNANPIYGGAVSLSREPSYGLLDLRAAYEIGDFRITAYVTNATKQNYRRTVLALGSTLSDFPGEPRIYGLKVGYRF